MTRSHRAPWPALLTVLLLVGCDSESDPVDPDGFDVPFTLVFEGSAAAQDGDISVTCAFRQDFVIEEVGTSIEGNEVWRGTSGGSVYREVLNPDGSGLAFHPLVAGTVVVELDSRDSTVRVVIPENAEGEGRFWKELALFEGTTTGDREADGSWSCQPLDLNSGGYVDLEGTAEGSWSYRLEG